MLLQFLICEIDTKLFETAGQENFHDTSVTKLNKAYPIVNLGPLPVCLKAFKAIYIKDPNQGV